MRRRKQIYKRIIPFVLSVPILAGSIMFIYPTEVKAETFLDKIKNRVSREEAEQPPVDLKITATELSKWQTKAVKIQVVIEDENDTGNMAIEKVEVQKSKGSDFVDITDGKTFELDENTTVTVRVSEQDGNVSTEEFKYDCFDLEKPEINAGMEGELLYIAASDSVSGVKCIYVNDVTYDELTDGMMTLNLKDYQSEFDSITIECEDNAGNKSDLFRIKNPYYTDEYTMEHSADNSKSNSKGTTASDPSSATGTVVAYTVNEEASDNGFGTTKKEFYTIRTDSDKTFYLVVDKNQSQDNVYLLTEVDENDLLNFVNYGGDEVDLGEVPLYTLDGSERNVKKEKAEETDLSDLIPDEEINKKPTVDEKPVNNASSTITIMVLIGVMGVAAYLLKKKMNKDDFDDNEDNEDADVPETEEQEEVSDRE